MSLIYYSEEEENNKEESINKYKDLFLEYEKNLPTLSEALKQMFISYGANEKKSDELTKDIISKCHKRIEENFEKIEKKYEKITKEDAYIICSYTCESKQKNFSPYRLLNRSLVSEDRKNGVNNISKYLYIFLNSLRKLEIYIPSKDNKYLYRCIDCNVGLSDDPSNKKYVPYKEGNAKTFWGFTSTSPNIYTTKKFLKKEVDDDIKNGTIFILKGDILGYDITLFNYYKEKEILLEPERKYVIKMVIPPINKITHIICKILKSPLVLDNIGKNIYDKIQKEKKEENIINNNDIKINCICRVEFETKIKDKLEFISGMGFLCNIKSKNMKALITYNHIINFDILNNENKISYINNNKNREINMKKNRYKYTNEELDITIIEIFDDEEENKNFIEIDKYINSRDYNDEEIYLVEYDKRKIKYLNDKIIKKENDYFLCNINKSCEGIIILKENLKLIGIIKNNVKNNDKIYFSINIIIDKINYMKCLYEIKKKDIGKEIQIINNRLPVEKNDQIEEKIKVIINGEILNILKYKFNKEGVYIIYIITEDSLTNISYMFYKCSKLKELNLSSFKTDQVTNMSHMFYECSGLKELNLLSFETDKVTNTSYMFNGCYRLKELNLSSFKTDKVTNMSNMFNGCSELKELKLSSFKTDQVNNISYMFSKCSRLKELNLSSFKTDNLTKISFMFYKCSELEELNLSSFKNDKVTDISYMFCGCSGLKELNLTSFKTDNVIDMSSLFKNCSGLKELNLSSFKTDKVTNMSSMF